MSRLGKKPIPVPSGVQVTVQKNQVKVKGPKGELTCNLEPGIGVDVKDGKINLSREKDDRFSRARHGLMRSLLSNMVLGVTEGYKKVLEIKGVGFRAQVQGKTLNLTLGFSHPTVFPLPQGIEASVEKQTLLTLKGVDKRQVGQTAALIRSLRPPEPYKGKGIKYSDEIIRRKEGKTGK